MLEESNESDESADPALEEMRKHGWHKSIEFYNSYKNIYTDSVYSTEDNYNCTHNLTFKKSQKDQKVICDQFFPTVIMSSPVYWKYAIEMGEYKNLADQMVQKLNDNNVMWLGDREIPYERDSSTDPESWNTEGKTNPFDEEHKPRIYVSLGTNANEKPWIFEGIMQVLGKKGYPSSIACGGSDTLYDTIDKYNKQNGWENITVYNYANQDEILAKTDVYFCHGGASSTTEGIYLEVPMVMVPQENADQPINSQIIKSFGIGEILDQTDAQNNTEKFVQTVESTLEDFLSNWKSYREKAKILSADMKNSMTYSDVATKIANGVQDKSFVPQKMRANVESYTAESQ